MNIRKATDDDCRWFYDLAMLPDVRANSVRSDHFTYEQHQQWWARRAHESGTFIYVAEVDGVRVGHVRFGRIPGTADAEIAISVVPEHRGHGIATEMLAKGMDAARMALGVDRFIALVLTHNQASQRLFERSGFRLMGWQQRFGRQVRRYVK